MERATEKQLLPELLHAAIRHFRSGEDAAGMEELLKAVDELESAIEAEHGFQQFQLHKLLPGLRELYQFMQNHDIAGMTDWLEYTAVPRIGDQPEGNGET